MAGTATRVLTCPAEDAFATLTDVRNHARWIPLTRIDAPAQLTVGARFTAVTGPGATDGYPGLAERMVVTSLVAPSTPEARTGRAVLRKEGPLLLGTAEIVVVPGDGVGALVTWVEDVHLRGLPARWTRRLLRPVLTAMTWYALRRVHAEVLAALRAGTGRNVPPPSLPPTQRSTT